LPTDWCVLVAGIWRIVPGTQGEMVLVLGTSVGDPR